MRKYWISWFGTNGAFELRSPWWISGYRYLENAKTGDEIEQASICAAVQAETEDEAKLKIRQSHDDKMGEIEWRFCEERPDDWSPFCDRFPRGAWMQWP